MSTLCLSSNAAGRQSRLGVLEKWRCPQASDCSSRVPGALHPHRVRNTERHTETHTQRAHRHTVTHRETHTETHTQYTQKYTHKNTQRDTEIHRNTHRDTHTIYTRTHTQCAHTQTHRDTCKHTEVRNIHTETHTVYTHRETHTITYTQRWADSQKVAHQEDVESGPVPAGQAVFLRRRSRAGDQPAEAKARRPALLLTSPRRHCGFEQGLLLPNLCLFPVLRLTSEIPTQVQGKILRFH